MVMKKPDQRKIERIVKPHVEIFSLKEEKSDYEFWRQQPVEKRLEALENMRQQYIKWTYGSEQGFQRVYRIIELSQR